LRDGGSETAEMRVHVASSECFTMIHIVYGATDTVKFVGALGGAETVIVVDCVAVPALPVQLKVKVVV